MVGGEIINFEDKPVPDDQHSQVEDHECGGDVTDIHFYTLTTTRGRMDVTMHVDHNGYYGGWLNGPSVVAELPKGAEEQK